jgi:Ni,Fe-hydrogenase III component G
LCKLKRSARSAADKLFFKDAPILMEFRRTTEANEEDNCEHYNRKHLRALAMETKVPVIAFDAVHEGTTQEAGMRMDANLFGSLANRLEAATGARVLLTHNLAVDDGLMNGSQGSIVDIVYADGCNPNHDSVANRMPNAVIVDFPGYTGKPFFCEPSKRTWVILLPHTCRSEEDREITRTQFPLCLAWALTPWKAQGMTLAKVIVKLGGACSKPGVLFVALTRVRHPDALLLEDDFPAFSVIRRQLAHPSFAARQRWERRMRVTFSRTLRHHMRDEEWFSETRRWTQAQNDLANDIVQFWRDSRDTTADTMVSDYCNRKEGAEAVAVRQVWARMQQYPHCFELASARG